LGSCDTSSFDTIYRVADNGDVETFYRGLGRPQGMAFDGANQGNAVPGYTFELDLVNDTVTCALRAPESGRTSNHSRYTVSNRDPAHTTITGSATHTAVHPTLDIRVEATCQTSSDADTYTHLSQVRITVDGTPHFSKSWSESVPRKLS